MSEATKFIIGSEVACGDGVCGELRRVVIDPVARAITHLVVEPKHRRHQGRLVPIDQVTSTVDGIQLRCTTAQFDVLQQADDTHLLLGAGGDWGYEPDQMLTLPYFRLGGSGLPLGVSGMRPHPHAVTADRLPTAEVQVHRGERVHATDGPIGRVRGLVIDPSDHHVTHVLLDAGHLWGQKRVAISIGAVARVDDGVRLSLTKDQVRDLPPVDIDQPG